MNIEGSEFLPIEPDLLWPLLTDLKVLRRVVPGCVKLSAVGPNEYQIEVQQRLGPYDDRFAGSLFLRSDGPGDGLDLETAMTSANGTVTLSGRVELEPAGDAGTLLRYNGRVEANGNLATVPPRLLETTAKAYTRRLLEALAHEVSGDAALAPLREELPSLQPASRNTGVNIPTWVVVLLAGVGGLLALRLLDNRRINRLKLSKVPETSQRGGGQ